MTACTIVRSLGIAGEGLEDLTFATEKLLEVEAIWDTLAVLTLAISPAPPSLCLHQKAIAKS